MGPYPEPVEWLLLEGLPGPEVRRVLAAAQRRRFARREVLFHEGDPAACVHLVDRGRVAVRVTTPLGSVAMLELLGPGDVLGEMAVLGGPGRRAATAVAVEATETLAIDAGAFADLRRQDPSVTDVLVQLLADRVARLNERLLEALYLPADARLLRRVLEMADVYGDDVPLTQDDLAGLAGTTRATVNRVLRREERAGSLRLGRGKLTVLDRPSLARRAH